MPVKRWVRCLAASAALITGILYALEHDFSASDPQCILYKDESFAYSGVYEKETVPEDSGTASLRSENAVNINTADRELLMTLPGIGPAKADAILAYRASEGAFRTPEELMLVSGIKEKTYSALADCITVGEEAGG